MTLNTPQPLNSLEGNNNYTCDLSEQKELKQLTVVNSVYDEQTLELRKSNDLRKFSGLPTVIIPPKGWDKKSSVELIENKTINKKQLFTSPSMNSI